MPSHTQPSSHDRGLKAACSVLAFAALFWTVATIGAIRLSHFISPRPNVEQGRILLSRMQEDPQAAAESAWRIMRGQKVFRVLCLECHGRGGVGVQWYGKRLIDNAFIQSLDNQALTAFIKRGRDPKDPMNTTQVEMPGMARLADLTDQDYLHLISYLRSLQPSASEPLTSESRPKQGIDSELARRTYHGRRIFQTSCAPCHGSNGLGIADNGKKLAQNQFVMSASDADLRAFIKKGRSASDPANTTGRQMPPRGGNPHLTDSDLTLVISYLRTLQLDHPAESSDH